MTMFGGVLYQHRLAKNETEIILELGSEEENIEISLMKIPHQIDFYTIEANHLLEAVYIQHPLLPKVILHWGRVELKHKYARLVKTLPSNKYVTWLTAYQISKIIKGRYYFLLFSKTSNGQTRMLNIKDVNWQSDCLGALPSVTARL
jgi:hypothetical protein